jgi:hypothetical protein
MDLSNFVKQSGLFETSFAKCLDKSQQAGCIGACKAWQWQNLDINRPACEDAAHAAGMQ